MFETYNSYGYDLYQPFENIDQWVIDLKNGQIFHGTLKEVVSCMIKKLNFNMDNIEDALNLLADSVDCGDNAIHFGVLQTAIFTYKKEIDFERAS